MYKTVAIFFTCFYSLSFFSGNAQQEEDVFYERSLDTTIAFYKTSVAENLQLYNGSEYHIAGHNVAGFPYFETDSFMVGSISYYHKSYTNVLLQYDIVKDVVIIKDYKQNYFIQLISSDIDSFSILNKTFVPLSGDQNNYGVAPGFYEILYNGNVSLYAKKQKAEVQSINEGVAESKYVETNSYFLKKNGLFYEIENESSLLNVLNDKVNIVRKFAKENRIDFKNDFENALVKTVAYYSGSK